MKKRKMLCALLVVMLVLNSRSVGYVYAAQESKSSEIPESIDSPIEESQTTPDTLSELAESEIQSDNTNTMTEEELAAYYGSSVFIGDSIMVGFRNYCAKQKTFAHNIQFLAAGNYSVFNALKPVTANSVHPMYRGKKYQVWFWSNVHSHHYNILRQGFHFHQKLEWQGQYIPSHFLRPFFVEEDCIAQYFHCSRFSVQDLARYKLH